MKRGAVLIGVNRTGGLPVLTAAASSAVAMRDWAKEQGMETALIIDSEGPVTPRMIRDAVRKFVDAGTYDQLLVYFAGHGVNLRYSEYWLLSDAPDDTQAAVNVLGSATLARYCGIGHVVFISDACRTAADTVQAQFVTGSEIFPNEGQAGVERPVDLFYACTLGRPAYEMRSAEDAAAGFRGAYTDALLSALDGRVPAAVDWEATSPRRGHVRMRMLKRALSEKVPAMMAAAGVAARVFQEPDAHIASDDAAWIAELPPPGNPLKTYRSGPARALPPAPPEPARQAFSWLVAQAAQGRPEWAGAGGAGPAASTAPAAADLLARSGQIAQAVAASDAGAGSFDAVGATIDEAWTRDGPAERLSTQRIRACPGGLCVVLLTFGNGCLALLPAFPAYRATLSFDVQGDLVDVAYETVGAGVGSETARQLRALAAVGTLDGRFQLDEGEAAGLAEVALAQGLDPALALYGAYADTGQGRRARAASWDAAMRRGLGVTWCDLVLLASEPRDAAQAYADAPLALPFPARSTGWALLDALGVHPAPELAPLRKWLTQSPWTTFAPAALPILQQLINGGKR